MYCGTCGTPAADGAQRCTQCGAAIAPDTSVTSAPPGASGPLSYTGTNPAFPTAPATPTDPAADPSLYAPPREPSNFQFQGNRRACPTCGKIINANADVCLNCGTMVSPAASGLSGMPARNKTTAILLAVFLGPWTWVYTWKRDRQKFFISIAIAIFLVILIIAAFASSHPVFDYCDANGTCYTKPSDLGTIVGEFLLLGVVDFGFWLWAVIGACVRNERWYYQYPMG